MVVLYVACLPLNAVLTLLGVRFCVRNKVDVPTAKQFEKPKINNEELEVEETEEIIDEDGNKKIVKVKPKNKDKEKDKDKLKGK